MGTETFKIKHQVNTTTYQRLEVQIPTCQNKGCFCVFSAFCGRQRRPHGEGYVTNWSQKKKKRRKRKKTLTGWRDEGLTEWEDEEIRPSQQEVRSLRRSHDCVSQPGSQIYKVLQSTSFTASHLLYVYFSQSLQVERYLSTSRSSISKYKTR